MPAVDTNVLVRLIARDDAKQAAAAEAFVAGGAWVSVLALADARKAGHGPLGTFDRELAKVTGAARV